MNFFTKLISQKQQPQDPSIVNADTIRHSKLLSSSVDTVDTTPKSLISHFGLILPHLLMITSQTAKLSDTAHLRLVCILFFA